MKASTLLSSCKTPTVQPKPSISHHKSSLPPWIRRRCRCRSCILLSPPLRCFQTSKMEWHDSSGQKHINFGVRTRAAMLQGIHELTEAVKVTMGPKGCNVIIEKSYGDPKVTKDGITVAKSIEFKERAKNVGASLIKQVVNATNMAAGDGTTCATVLTQAILTEGCKAVAAGVNVMDLRRGINMGIDAVISHLQSRSG